MKVTPMRLDSRRRGFTLIELLVVVAIIALLAAILFPVFSRARENARRSSCQSNLKQMGLAVIQYSQDFDEKYPGYVVQVPGGCGGATPGYYYWPNLLQPYIKSTQLFICPSTRATAPPTITQAECGAASITIPYGINYNLFAGLVGYIPKTSVSHLDMPAETVLVTDSVHLTVGGAEQEDYIAYAGLPGGYYGSHASGGFQTSYRHLETGNVLFCDGHVKVMRYGELTKAVANTGRNVAYRLGSDTAFTTSAAQVFHYWQTSADAGQFY